MREKRKERERKKERERERESWSIHMEESGKWKQGGDTRSQVKKEHLEPAGEWKREEPDPVSLTSFGFTGGWDIQDT